MPKDAHLSRGNKTVAEKIPEVVTYDLNHFCTYCGKDRDHMQWVQAGPDYVPICDECAAYHSHISLHPFIEVLNLAQEEAQRFHHHYIGTEHLLLALIREGEGGPSEVLAKFGLELNKVRD